MISVRQRLPSGIGSDHPVLFPRRIGPAQRWLTIALVITSCTRWEELRVEDVRSGRVSIEGRPVEADTKTQAVEFRSASVSSGRLVGHTLDGAAIEISLDEVIRLRVPTRVQAGEAVLWTVLILASVGAVIVLALLSEIKPSR